MAGEILIFIVGFIRWLIKGCKTDLEQEIYGKENSEINIRGRNYLIGIFFILFVIIITKLL